MNIPHVFAKATANVSDLGYPVAIRMGSCWFADDPLVKARPELFTEDCRFAIGRERSWSGDTPKLMEIPPEDEPPVRRGPGRPRIHAA